MIVLQGRRSRLRRSGQPTAQRYARPARPATRVAILLVNHDHARLVAATASAHKMSEAMTVEGTATAPARPTGAEGCAL